MVSSSTSITPAKAIHVIAPHENVHAQKLPVSIFLAGSIEMGKAPEWQKEIISTLANHPFAIYNPRRGPEFKWEAGNDALFKEQVDWEHKHLSESSIIAMFISGETKAPISLMEMGMFATSGRLIVACEKNFWRLGNVQWVCRYYGITLVHTLGDLVVEVEKRAKQIEIGRFTVRNGHEVSAPTMSVLESPWTYALAAGGLAVGFGLARIRL